MLNRQIAKSPVLLGGLQHLSPLPLGLGFWIGLGVGLSLFLLTLDRAVSSHGQHATTLPRVVSIASIFSAWKHLFISFIVKKTFVEASSVFFLKIYYS